MIGRIQSILVCFSFSWFASRFNDHTASKKVLGSHHWPEQRSCVSEMGYETDTKVICHVGKDENVKVLCF